MSAYAVGRLTQVNLGPGITEYLERIDATLAPFNGRFIIHGDPPEQKEGRWIGALIVIEFPDMAAARAWYASPVYQAILHLRTDNARGEIILIEGVPTDHKATDVLKPRVLEDAP